MTRLAFDCTNVFDAACGKDTGVSLRALQARAPAVESALGRLRASCDSEDGFFLDLPDRNIASEHAMAQDLQRQFDTLVVIGIGGSALGTRAIYRGLLRPHTHRFRDGRARGTGMRLYFMENVDPIETADLLDVLDLERTVFNVVTKSGKTIETLSTLLIVRERLISTLGMRGYRKRVICTTDRGDNPLRMLAREDQLQTLDIQPGVGGRYSALSAVGSLPLLCAGLDVHSLLKGARAARDNAFISNLEDNAAAAFALVQATFIECGTGDVVFMPYIPQFADLGEWFVQLWAESLGKTRDDGTAVGPTPSPAIGARDQHSLLQLMMEGPPVRNIVFVEDAHMPSTLRVPQAPEVLAPLAHLGGRPLAETLRAERRGVEAALREAGRPSSTLRLYGVREETIGAFVMMLEIATALTGLLLGVNPFNQPGVELGKRYAHGILGHPEHAGMLKRLDADEARVPQREPSF